ncbi:MAG: hypothetical protein PHD82_12095 [Candidatus Riflebacteria bacterium]|nr:hypothetical protein [Candidatus Riflebacteria bacterium]
MRKLFGLLVAVALVFTGVSFAQDAAAPAPATTETAAPAVDAAAPVPAVAEYTSVVQVTPADAENNETAATIILDLGEQALKLVAGDAAKLAELEQANGKNVTVKGTLVPAGEGHLMDMLQVQEWAEAAAPAATEEPAATEAPVEGN